MELTAGRFVVPVLVNAAPTFVAEQPATNIGRWSHVAATNDGHVVFYWAKTGAWVVRKVERAGSLTHVADGANGPTGATALAAAGQTLILLYWKNGDVEVWEVRAGAFVKVAAIFKAEWAAKTLAPNENGILLLQHPSLASFSVGFRPDGTEPVVQLRRYEPNTEAFDESWSDALCIGVVPS